MQEREKARRRGNEGSSGAGIGLCPATPQVSCETSHEDAPGGENSLRRILGGIGRKGMSSGGEVSARREKEGRLSRMTLSELTGGHDTTSRGRSEGTDLDTRQLPDL